MACIFSIICKNKTDFQLSLVSKRMLSSTLTGILAKDIPAQQFETTQDLLKKAKIHNMETQPWTFILYAINFKKVRHFKLFYCQFCPLGNLQKLLIGLYIPVFICTLFGQVTTKYFPGCTLGTFYGEETFGGSWRSLMHNNNQALAAMTSKFLRVGIIVFNGGG